MLKRMFLTLVLSLCAANFGAFAANPRGNARGVAVANNAPSATASSTVSARAATRNTAATALKTNTAPVSARAAVRNTPKVAATASAASPVKAARAASTQKVINNGTKVASAASNTVIDQECQNAFYGCMDSFCMIDNASGGRCQCSNRNAELSSVMDDIAKLDEQSYLMATEGVERIQMGESADQIIARAKAAGDQAVGKTPTTSNAANNQKKVRTLDLSAWNTNIFSEDEDIFDDVDISVDASAVSNALSKTGDALYTDAAKMCIAQMPAKCNASVKMLQSVYAQKIKSDCTAFENSLKQQKIASTQKLQAAEKALRDAALDEFKDKNKYNLGGCVQEYARCMQNECGDDYSNCITLSAQENMMGGAGKVKDRTIKGVVDIVLSGSTMNQLLSKKTICDDEVLVHCENYRAQVWDKYIEGAATALKSAELNAEDDARQNCIRNVADCFRNSCAQQWNPESDAKNYDMCLSDPMLLYDSCKIRVESCIVATGGSVSDTQDRTTLKQSRLWMGVESMLAALRVDACTKEVKTCIEDICGKDYSGCVGLDTNSIGNLCPVQKLTACMTKFDETSVRDYIAEIAQGLAIQIDNSLAEVCQKAASDAVVKVCGDKDNCSNAVVDLDSLKSMISLQACMVKEEGEKECRPNVSAFTEDEIYAFEYSFDKKTKKLQQTRVSSDSYGVVADLQGMPDLSLIDFKEGTDKDTEVKKYMFVAGDDADDSTKKVITLLNNALDNIMNNIDQDPKVTYCKTGRKIQGFKGLTNSESGTSNVGGDIDALSSQRFPNLTKEYRSIIASQLLTSVHAKKRELEKSFDEKLVELDNKIAERYAEIAEQRGAAVEEAIDAYNLEKCTCNASKDGNGSKGCYSAKDKNTMREADGGYILGGGNQIVKNYIREVTDKVGAYDSATNTCTVETINYKCDYYLTPTCRTFKPGVVIHTSQFKMMKFK